MTTGGDFPPGPSKPTPPVNEGCTWWWWILLLLIMLVILWWIFVLPRRPATPPPGPRSIPGPTTGITLIDDTWSRQ